MDQGSGLRQAVCFFEKYSCTGFGVSLINETFYHRAGPAGALHKPVILIERFEPDKRQEIGYYNAKAGDAYDLSCSSIEITEVFYIKANNPCMKHGKMEKK